MGHWVYIPLWSPWQVVPLFPGCRAQHSTLPTCKGSLSHTITGVVLLPLFQTGKLRCRMTWLFAQSHTASWWQSSNQTGVSLTLLTARYPTAHRGQEDRQQPEPLTTRGRHRGPTAREFRSRGFGLCNSEAHDPYLQVARTTTLWPTLWPGSKAFLGVTVKITDPSTQGKGPLWKVREHPLGHSGLEATRNPCAM